MKERAGVQGRVSPHEYTTAHKPQAKAVRKMKLGKKVKLYDRVRWIRIPTAATATATSNISTTLKIEWFPGILYKDLTEAIADIHVEEDNKLRATLASQRFKLKNYNKKSPSVALVFKGKSCQISYLPSDILENEPHFPNTIHDFFMYEDEHWDKLQERVGNNDKHGNGHQNEMNQNLQLVLQPALQTMHQLIDDALRSDQEEINYIPNSLVSDEGDVSELANNVMTVPDHEHKHTSESDSTGKEEATRTGVTPENSVQGTRTKRSRNKSKNDDGNAKVTQTRQLRSGVTRKEQEGVRQLEPDFASAGSGMKEGKPLRRKEDIQLLKSQGATKSTHANTQETQESGSNTNTTKNNYATIDIGVEPHEAWNAVFKKMKKIGWRHTGGDLEHSYFYLKPGKKKRGGVYKEDYFVNEEELKDYAKAHYGWEGDDVYTDSSDSGGSPQSQSSTNTGQGQISSIGTSQDSEFGDASMEEENDQGEDEEEDMVDDASHHDQDASEKEQESMSSSNGEVGSDTFEFEPEKESASRGSSISGIKQYEEWDSVWEKLKCEGWNITDGAGRFDNAYLPPGKEKRKGVHGKDYFYLDALKEFVMHKYGWKGENIPKSDVPSNIVVTVEKQTARESGQTNSNKASASKPKKKKAKTPVKSKKNSKKISNGSTNHPKIKTKGKPSASSSKKVKKRGTASAFKKKKLDRDDTRIWGYTKQAPPSPINEITWDKLRDIEGWDVVKTTKDGRNYHYYARCGIDSDAIEQGKVELGVDFFWSEEDAIEYVRYHPDCIEDLNLSNACRAFSEMEEGSDEYNAQSGDKRKQQLSPVQRTPQKKHKGGKEDSISSVKSSSPESSPEEITWNVLRNQKGWTFIKAFNNLHDWYYVPPGVDARSKDAKLGVHYFETEAEAVKHYTPGETPQKKQQNDDNDASVSMKSSSPEPLSSPEFITWKVLKSEKGWTCMKAFNKLHDWYYIRPGIDAKSKDSKLGVHYFETEANAVRYYMNHSQMDPTPSSKGSAQMDPTPSSADSMFVPFSIEGFEHSWWLEEDLPKWNWSRIKNLLKSVKWTGGVYVAPDGRRCENAIDFRKHMCAIGLPECDVKDLSEDDQLYLERYFSLAHLPTRIGNHSMNRHNSIELLTHLLDLELAGQPFNNERAWEALCSYFECKKKKDGRLHAPNVQIEEGAIHYFNSLHELRSAIRAFGLNHYSGQDVKKDEYYTAIILWASVLPLPVYKDKNSAATKKVTKAAREELYMDLDRSESLCPESAEQIEENPYIDSQEVTTVEYEGPADVQCTQLTQEQQMEEESFTDSHGDLVTNENQEQILEDTVQLHAEPVQTQMKEVSHADSRGDLVTNNNEVPIPEELDEPSMELVQEQQKEEGSSLDSRGDILTSENKQPSVEDVNEPDMDQVQNEEQMEEELHGDSHEEVVTVNDQEQIHEGIDDHLRSEEQIEESHEDIVIVQNDEKIQEIIGERNVEQMEEEVDEGCTEEVIGVQSMGQVQEEPRETSDSAEDPINSSSQDQMQKETDRQYIQGEERETNEVGNLDEKCSYSYTQEEEEDNELFGTQCLEQTQDEMGDRSTCMEQDKEDEDEAQMTGQFQEDVQDEVEGPSRKGEGSTNEHDASGQSEEQRQKEPNEASSKKGRWWNLGSEDVEAASAAADEAQDMDIDTDMTRHDISPSSEKFYECNDREGTCTAEEEPDHRSPTCSRIEGIHIEKSWVYAGLQGPQGGEIDYDALLTQEAGDTFADSR